MPLAVSLVENESISLPLKHGPFHVHVTIPFSFLVRDFNPNTTQIPEMERSHWRWATRLFGRHDRHETPTDPASKAVTVAYPVFCNQVWPKLCALLFGKEEPMVYSVSGSDAKDWERAGDSNLFWAFSTGVTGDDINHARAVVLRANDAPSSTGGILFSVEELGDEEKAAWKRAWMDVVLYKSPGAGESEVDLAMGRKNHALYRYMAGSNEKESLESV